MNKLTGNGRPTVYTHGEVGQFYEDQKTGDIYECRQSSKYSKLHGAPIGGYIWELRASGEDRKEHGDFYQVSGGENGKKLVLKYDGETFNANMTYDEVMTAIKNDELTGSEFICEVYRPANDTWPEGAMFEPSSMIIRSYADGENPQFMLAYNYFTGSSFTVEKCYMGAWGVTRFPDGETEM